MGIRRRSAAVLGVALALLLCAPAGAQDPAGVALVGSLQSELGCPGDWQPECAATELEPVDGSPGLYRATFDVPAGAYAYKVALNDSWTENYGAGGAPGGADIPLTAPGGPITFTYDHATHRITDDTAKPPGAEQGAHWLRIGLIAWTPPEEAASFRLHWAAAGGMAVSGGAIAGGESAPLALDPDGLPGALAAQYPHLTAYAALRLPADVRREAAAILTGQVLVAAYDAGGDLLGVTGVQIPGVLDDLYASAASARLGPVWTGTTPSLSVWAPTAEQVHLLVDAAGPATEQRLAMDLGADGVWRITGEPGWKDARYAFEVEVYVPAADAVVTNVVTDPYALGLTMNSERSILVDLRDPALAPAGWPSLAKPGLAQYVDTTLYELHVRDFSATDETVPAAHRGRFLAFTHPDSDGMRHLRGLAQAGLNSLHLLPVNDIASIEEDPAEQEAPACDLGGFPPDSEAQQACLEPVRDTDAFNWGYDPLHYTAPEGSYASDPDGTARTREFRQMVQGINGAGLRVIVDVVYNHTPAAGQDPKAVLDRIVPGYYHRLNPVSGAVETSTCCSNTATEHRMMEKLMLDSVLTWAREYKVDGFRFDLMGHHSRENMLAVRRALDGLTLARDGVDGKRMYVYGEGWNFGEVADDARFVNATQLNMAGTRIGTFNDRLRDAVRGGGPFDEDMRRQGFASGLATDPNGAEVNGTPDEQRARLLLYQDQIRVGLAGNLRDFVLLDREGSTVTGAEVPYGEASGQTPPTGYAADPADTVTYVDAHDNETLFDALQYKLPPDTPMADRVRMSTLALATTALGQSPSFWHAGADLLRSKSFDHNSYNSGDWFNRIDWSGQESTWGSGLPPQTDNGSRWPIMRPLLADPALEPGATAMGAAAARARDLLRIRFSTPLFRLGDARLIKQRVSFPGSGPGQAPGVITMAIDDRAGQDVDPELEGVVVVFNATPAATRQTFAGLAGRRFALHPVQAGGGDAVVRAAAYDAATGSFAVPARTVAVFVEGKAPPGGGPPVTPPRGPCLNRVVGTAAGERLTGTSAGDRITGLRGDDVITGRGGRDCLRGKAGDDRVSGGRGADVVEGQRGTDRLRGGPGADTIAGGRGDDRIAVRDGRRDVVDCGRGTDRVVSRDREDRLRRCERRRPA